MRNHKFIIACAVLTGAGFLLAAAGIAAGGLVTGVSLNATGFHVYAPRLLEKDERALYTQEEVQTEPFQRMQVSTEYADIYLQSSDTDEYRISYCVGTETGIRYEVKDQTLLVQQGNGAALSSSWFQNFSWFTFGSNSLVQLGADQKKEFIMIQVPKKELAEIVLRTESGNVSCEHMQAGGLAMEAEYGNVSFKDLQTGDLKIDMESGNLWMEQVRGRSCSLSNEDGDLTINGLKLDEDLRMDLDTGNIQLQGSSLRDLQLDGSYSFTSIRQCALRDMTLYLESENCILEETSFENCDIKSEYGDVSMELKEPLQSYGYQLETEYGEITVDGRKLGEMYETLDADTKRKIRVQCESGDIRIEESR